MKIRLRGLMVLAAASAFLSADARAGGLVDIPFDADNFSDPLTIDNPYWPLAPGTTFTYLTASGEDCEVDEVTVTSNTKMIEGVQTREVHDQAWEDPMCNGMKGPLVEDTLDWYAQDKAGNIWYFGEATSEATGSWEAGQAGADPGIVILARPQPGDFYSQENAPGEAEDQGKVLRLNAKVSLTLDNQIDPDQFSGCMETKESSPLEPGAIEHKFYCPDLGLVVIEELKGKTVRTELFEVHR
jgi:hypothetical protein